MQPRYAFRHPGIHTVPMRLIVLLLSLSLTYAHLSDRSTGGIYLEESCRPHQVNITLALAETYVLVIQGLLEAQGRRARAFDLFFRPQDRPLLELAFYNFEAALRGRGPVIHLTCIEDDFCLSDMRPNLFVNRTDTIQGYLRMNICERVWSGHEGQIKSDFCADWQVLGLSVSILHEMTHFHPLTNGTAVHDYFYDPVECQQIAQGKFSKTDSDTGEQVIIEPMENAQNWVMMAVESLKITKIQRGECPRWTLTNGRWRWIGDKIDGELNGRDELRRLLMRPQ